MLKTKLHRTLPAAFSLCLFAFVLGVRWAVFDRFGMTMPEWDQWDAEGLMLLAPWYDNDHFLRALFSPHNEHRVVLTKLLNLGLTLANGQWDQRLEATFNALFPATIAVSFFLLARRHLTRRWLAPLTIFLGVIFAFPFAWQNILGGFHSQQFFLVGLALVAIALLPFHPPFSPRWWLGAAAAAAGLFSMASGFFGAVVAIGLLGVQYFRRERTLRSALPTLIVCALVSAVGWFTRHEFPPHAALKAQNLHDFAFTIIRSLQWPAPASPWFALILWLPWTWLVARVVFSPRPLTAPSRAFGYFVLGLGVWVGLQLIATGYARGAGGPAPASRYIDTLVFGLVANALALVWLATPELLSRPARRILASAALVWIGVFAWGATHELRQIFLVELPPVKVYHDYCEINVRNYLYTGDPSFLNHDEIPYPGASSFLVRIDRPSLRALMPATVRPPLPLTATRSDFVRSSRTTIYPPAPGLAPSAHPLAHRSTWGSFTPRDLVSPREFTSAPLHLPSRGWLKFEPAGAAGEPGVIFELRDAATGLPLNPIRPDKSPRDTWRAAYVPVPSRAFVIYARAPDAARWLAFSEPVTMGSGSYRAWQLSKNGQLIATIALAAAAALAALAFWSRVPPPRPR
ncbi:MAG: hypothetical protein H7343_12100 [Undibacterium sp.]|nr:hypothetical protein [Opitutaceae bacterium]